MINQQSEMEKWAKIQNLANIVKGVVFITLIIIVSFYIWDMPHIESLPPKPSKECQPQKQIKKMDYKQAYKQAIDSYSHLTLEELGYAVNTTVPVPKALMSAYMHRNKQEYKKNIKEIRRLSQLSNEEFIRQVR